MIGRLSGFQISEPVAVQWLDQVHGSDCVYVGKDSILPMHLRPTPCGQINWGLL